MSKTGEGSGVVIIPYTLYLLFLRRRREAYRNVLNSIMNAVSPPKCNLNATLLSRVSFSRPTDLTRKLVESARFATYHSLRDQNKFGHYSRSTRRIVCLFSCSSVGIDFCNKKSCKICVHTYK